MGSRDGVSRGKPSRQVTLPPQAADNKAVHESADNAALKSHYSGGGPLPPSFCPKKVIVTVHRRNDSDQESAESLSIGVFRKSYYQVPRFALISSCSRRKQLAPHRDLLHTPYITISLHHPGTGTRFFCSGERGILRGQCHSAACFNVA